MGPGQTLSDSRFLGQKHCQRTVQPPWWEPVPFWVLIFQLDNSMRTRLEEPPENSLETDCVSGCGYGYRQASVYTCVHVCVYTVTGKWGSPEILSGVQPPVTGVHDGSCQIDVLGLHRHSLRLLCSMLRQHFQWGVSALQIIILYAQSCFHHPNYRNSILMELACLEICRLWAPVSCTHTQVILLNKVSLHPSKVGAG